MGTETDQFSNRRQGCATSVFVNMLFLSTSSKGKVWKYFLAWYCFKVVNIFKFDQNLTIKKLWLNRFHLGYIVEFLSQVDEKWAIFFNGLLNDPKYLKVFQTVVNCQECIRFFQMGKDMSRLSELTFAQLYEFDESGGDRFRFSEFVDRDDEGKHTKCHMSFVTY